MSKMKWYGIALGVVVLFIPTPGTAQPSQRTVSEESALFQQLEDGVFTIFGDRAQGSGFLVDARGLVLTNAHVVASSSRLSVQLDDTTKVPATLVVQDKRRDIAVLAIHPRFVKDRPVLRPALREGGELAFVGEKVIAIGSPLGHRRALTLGIVSKVEDRAILSDVNQNPGSSGGPLINMDAEVIGITTFGLESSQGGQGISGSISISESFPMIQAARLKLNEGIEVSDVTLPIAPKVAFPLEALAVGYERSQEDAYYTIEDVPGFEVTVITPLRKYVLETKEKARLATERRRRESAAGVPSPEMYDPLGERLRGWFEYAGDYSPLVLIHVAPRIGQTKGSIAGNVFGGVAAGLSGAPYYSLYDLEFKADLQDFVLLNGEEEIREVFRGMGMMPVSIDLGSVAMKDIAQRGMFAYLPEVFSDLDSSNLHFRVVDLKHPEKEIDVPVPRATLEQIWADFESYRDMKAARVTPLVLERSVVQ